MLEIKDNETEIYVVTYIIRKFNYYKKRTSGRQMEVGI